MLTQEVAEGTVRSGMVWKVGPRRGMDVGVGHRRPEQLDPRSPSPVLGEAAESRFQGTCGI